MAPDLATILAPRLAEHRQHLERLGLPSHGIDLILSRFAEAPVRSPKGGPANVVSRTAFRKPGVTNDTESITLEFEHLYELETNPAVHDYRTQALTLTVHPEQPIEGGGTRRRGWDIHPDVLVIEDGRVVARDLMREDELAAIANLRPWYIHRDPADPTTYRCPSAEAAAANLGIEYEIVSSTQHDRLRARGLRYLYRFGDHEVLASARDAMLDLVTGAPGTTIAELISAGAGGRWSVGDALGMLAQRLLFIDLAAHAPDDHAHARVYVDAATARAFAIAHTPSWAAGGDHPKRASIKPGTVYALGERKLELFICTGDEIHFRPADEVACPNVIYRRVEFERLVAIGTLVEMGVEAQADMVRQAVAAAWLAAPAGARATASARWRAIEVHRANRELRHRGRDPLPIPMVDGKVPSMTSLDRWHSASEKSSRIYGDVLLGLLPKPRRGRPGLRKDKAVEAVIHREIGDYYANGKGRSKKALIRKIQAECEKVLPGERPDRKTIMKRLEQYDHHKLGAAHDGEKVAYADKPYAPLDPDALPPRGLYPFQRCQYDTTVADEEVIDHLTGRPLGRPIHGRLVDSYSDRKLGHHWEFGAPRVGNLLALLVEIAEHYGYLMEELFLDNALSHWAEALQVFTAAHRVHVTYRPMAQGRWGGPVELSFQRITDGLFHQLPGNTRAMKDVRSVTKATNAKGHAVFTLPELDRLVRLFDEQADASRIVKERGLTPKAAFERGLVEHGGRDLPSLVVDEAFRIKALVPVGSRKARGTKGVEVNNLTYQHACLECPGVVGRAVDVAGDHRDITRMWVFVLAHRHGPTYVDARWVEARCRLLAPLRVASARELDIATQVVRERLRDDNRKRVDLERAIGQVLLEAERVEKLAEERRRTLALADVAAGEGSADPAGPAAEWAPSPASQGEQERAVPVDDDPVAAALRQIETSRYGDAA